MAKKYLLSSTDEDEDSKWVKKFRNGIISGILSILIVWPLFPNFFPYHPINDFWFIKGNVFDWINSSYYLFLWAIAINLIVVFSKRSDRSYDYTPKQILKKGLFSSIFAGVFEEITFRWVIFLGMMVTVYISNWVLGGFIGESWGIVQWFNNLMKAPIANYLTFGLLNNQIKQPTWYAGAALIVANGLFRDGHRYQGFFGFVNSWFGGMFLFYILFRYGLVASIFVHFAHNLLCYLVAFVEVWIFRKITGIKSEKLPKETAWQKKLREIEGRRFQT